MATDVTQVDYEILEEISGRFRYQADDVFALLRSLRQHMHDLQENGWIGLGSNAFYTEMEYEVLPAVNKLAESLDSASLTVQKIGDLFAVTEEEASTTIQTGR